MEGTRVRKCLLGYCAPFPPGMRDQISLSEVLDKNDVTIQRIHLCIKDCLLIRRDRQPRHTPRGMVLQVENSRRPKGSNVEVIDPRFRRHIEVINAVVDHGPIAPITWFQSAYELGLFATASRNAP